MATRPITERRRRRILARGLWCVLLWCAGVGAAGAVALVFKFLVDAALR